MSAEPGDEQLRLRRYLGAQLGPLAVLLVVFTWLSAPVAFVVLGRREIEVRAEATAKEVALLLARDAQERPRLWRYDSVKILDRLHHYEQHEGLTIEVLDQAGQRVDPDARDLALLRAMPAVWRTAPIVAGRERVGAVWVAGSTSKLHRDSIALLLGFGLLGLVLGGLVYALPMRAMGRAGRQLRRVFARLKESQHALAALNEGLEHQVELRSVELKDAYQQLQLKEQRLREISVRAVNLQESERRGIARELHDSAAQALTAIRIHLQLISGLLAQSGSSPKLLELAERTTTMVDDTVEEIRRAVNQLAPAVLDDVGLEAAVRRACDDLADTSGVDVQCDIRLGERLEASVETTCYRIVQESLTNVARYAKASHVTVRLEAMEDRVRVTVQDDGVGFAAEDRRPRSRGLVGMHERAELLGGQTRVESAPGEGTKITANVPTVSAGPIDPLSLNT